MEDNGRQHPDLNQGKTMPKGQQRSNREKKKPKQPKPVAPAKPGTPQPWKK